MNPLSLGLTGKVILGLSLALLLSLGGNFWLVRHAWIKYGEDKSAAKVANLQAQVSSYQMTEAVNKALSKVAKEDHAKFLAQLQGIADDMAANKSRSKTVTRANPLPANCKPGKARMDSVNQTLGAQR